jgi:glycosyltransferase involved in cell wall biosynthesis
LKKLAIISSHPIQYNAPFFKQLAQNDVFTIKVFYTWGQSESGNINDPDFNINRKWDIDLMNGYDYCFVENKAANPGSHHFSGINNPGLNKKIISFNPDVLLVFGWSFKSHLAAIRYFKGKLPIIFRGDSTLIDAKKGMGSIVKSFIRRQFLSWVYRHIDYALFVGTSNYDYYLKMGLKKQQLLYGPHAIDNQRFNTISEEQQIGLVRWKSDLGIEKDDFVFLFVGKFDHKKNPLLLIEAFAQLKHPSAKLVFIGDGILLSSIQAAADVDPRIKCLGFQNQSIMPLLYRLGNVLVLPSSGPNETWGLAMNEAMASGLPIIASDKCGGAIDLVTPITGLIFESGNQTALYMAMLHYIDNRSICKSNGEHAQSHIQQFNYYANIKSLQDLTKQF